MTTRTKTNLALVGVILLGVVLLAVGLPVDGFFGGLLQGAGVGVAVAAVFFLGYTARHHDGERLGRDVTDAWLPSRDARR